ncbi:hypothetical protein [Fimbriiglobus ruber]|uniref:Uncharacterized protein n=1 Tax=Fimbriiglobus ruber TaxID=1908690 RepID=A0A225DGA9_9BACT|nr:hypothetical protein [Fimbriiglobus ruber]OWK37548.1 hypothetical protein FRUB_06668 [Fimbriiglobus ruber]
MASVWLADYECERAGELPPVCMTCGDRAETVVWQKFRWNPSWAAGGLLTLIIATLFFTRSRVVPVPLCDRHGGHLYYGKLATLLISSVVIGVIVWAIVCGSGTELHEATHSGLNRLLAIYVVLIGSALGVESVCRRRIRSDEMTAIETRLIGVSENFATALRAQRLEKRDEWAKCLLERGIRPDQYLAEVRGEPDQLPRYHDYAPTK